MRVYIAFLVASFIATGSVALPELNDRGSCKQDACALAVSKGPPYSPNASDVAKKDCASYVKTVITPCPVTTTKKATITGCGKSSTAITTKTVTKTGITTATETKSLTTTITSTITTQSTSTSLIVITSPTSTVTRTETKTTTTTSASTTITITVTPNSGIQTRRDLNIRGDHKTSRPCQVTSTPTRIPNYAATCKGSAYSSACSCLGVKPSVTTAPTETHTYLSTVTCKSDKPVVTSTTTKTVTQPVSTKFAATPITKTYTSTTTASVTQVTTTFVVTTSKYGTTKTTTTQTTTVVETAATATATTYACPLLETVGPNEGNYVLDDFNRLDLLTFTPDRSKATNFYLNNANQLVAFRRPVVLLDGTNGRLALTNSLPNEVSPLNCTYSEAIGMNFVRCNASTGDNVFLEVPGENLLRFGREVGEVDGKSTAIIVLAHDCPAGTELPG